jgi:electron transfer flavoprotein beta subunit
VVTTDLRLNEPRFVKMPDIMKARGKPLESIDVSDLDLPAVPRLETIALEPPAKRGGGRKVADAAELVRELRDRGVL